MGLAVFLGVRPNFMFKWSNQQFNSLFECNNSCDALQLKMFCDIDPQPKYWSLQDILMEVNKDQSPDTLCKLFELKLNQDYNKGQFKRRSSSGISQNIEEINAG